jgi:hypothetical protein
MDKPLFIIFSFYLFQQTRFNLLVLFAYFAIYLNLSWVWHLDSLGFDHVSPRLSERLEGSTSQACQHSSAQAGCLNRGHPDHREVSDVCDNLSPQAAFCATPEDNRLLNWAGYSLCNSQILV